MKYFIIFFIILLSFVGCTSKKLLNKKQKHECSHNILGSIIRVQDSNELKYFFLQVTNSNVKIFDTIFKLPYEVFIRKLLDVYDFNKIYSISDLDTLTIKFFQYQLKDTIAPLEVQKNILKDTSVIYSNDIFESSNMIWYCRNGYLPINGSYEGPTIYLNHRRCMNITKYHFIKDW